MALPNSYYSWIYQTIWGLKHLLVGAGTREVIDEVGGTRFENFHVDFDGTKGPYLLLRLQWDSAPTTYGNVCVITVDGNVVTPEEGQWDGMVLNDPSEVHVGRDGTWQPFLLASRTLEIKSRAKVRNLGGNFLYTIMRLGA